MIELMLTPNQNSKYEVGPEGNKRTEYEMVEVSVPTYAPIALLHVDAFYRRGDLLLYDALVAGKAVKVQVSILEIADGG
jgi:hypothetical protein